jgi:hypothetical protein
MPLSKRTRLSWRERITEHWLPRLWLPAVVLLTVALLVSSTSLPFNPTRVPTWLIVVVFAGWMWLWYRLHNVVPAVSTAWFGGQVSVVLLCGLAALWFVGYVALRERLLVRAPSPDGRAVAALTGYPGNYTVYINSETTAGLLLRRDARVDFYREGDLDPSIPLPPDHVDLIWSRHQPVAALVADGTYAAAFDLVDGRLVERRDTRFQPTAIAAALETPATGGGGRVVP